MGAKLVLLKATKILCNLNLALDVSENLGK